MDYAYLLRCLIPFLAVVVIFLVINLNVIPRFDRARIREHIEEHGGKVVEMIRATGHSHDRAYKVTFMTSHGKQVQATCRTYLNEVYWISDRPPDLFADESERAHTS